MVEFNLPKNSVVNPNGKVFVAPKDAKKVKTFKIYRWNPDDGHNPSIDTFFLQLGNWGSLSLISEIYHLESNKIIYKKVLRDPDCNFILGSETITKECFTILEKKEKPISKEQYNDIRNFIQECGFWGFPTRFHLSCMDGNYVSVFLREKDSFKYVGVSCPPAQHSIQQLLNQIIQLL